MGLMKWIFASHPYEVMCRVCGQTGEGNSLKEAIHYLQELREGCGQGFHEPVISRQPQ